MFHPLQSLFKRRTFTWEESDVRHYVQRYLQERLHTEEVYCERAREGVVVVRVGSATARQAVVLLEFELGRDLTQHTAFMMERLLVRVTA